MGREVRVVRSLLVELAFFDRRVLGQACRWHAREQARILNVDFEVYVGSVDAAARSPGRSPGSTVVVEPP